MMSTLSRRFLLASAAALLLSLGGLGQTVYAKLTNPAIGKVRHVVLYAYKPEVSAEKQAEIAQRSRELINQIPLIEDIEWGPDVNAGARAQGYTHCVLMTFASPGAVKEYVAHPAHQAFLELAKPHLEKLLVMDYIAQE